MLQGLLLYAAIVVAAAFQEEFAPLAGALAVRNGRGEIVLVGIAVALGSWLHGVALYSLGRRGRAVLSRPALQKPLALVRTHQRIALLGIRFAYGIRLTLPIACGAADVGAGPFFLWTAVSSLAWSALFTAIGWFAGAFALGQIRHYRRFEIRAAVILVALGAIFWVWRRSRARSETGEPRVA